MGSARESGDWRNAHQVQVEAAVIGGGFGGVYTLHKLRQAGVDAKLFEAGKELGGVWHWNRYPGARVDCEAPYYQFSLPELYKDWNFSERFPGHVELRKYFHHIATVLGLYDHIALGEAINGCDFNLAEKRWLIKSETGKTIECKYLIIAAGSSYKKFFPDFDGLQLYKGTLLHAAAFPEEGIDFAGKRVGIIGQGATGVQLVQEISKVANHLGIFCRTPNIALPMRQRNLSIEEQEQFKAIYPVLFKLCRSSRAGFPYYVDTSTTKTDPPEVREAKQEIAWNRGAFNYFQNIYRDYMVDHDANNIMYNFWQKKTAARIKDPKKREIFAPKIKPHPFGGKRPSLEQDYYECIDRPNVEAINLNETPIVRFDGEGIITSDGTSRKYDIVILATGYDSITGSFTSMGLRDTQGVDMRERWKEGVRTHLGMTTPGFPNMFMIYSPQAPTALANGTTVIEVQGDWVVSTITKMKKENIETLEAQPEAAEKWNADIQEMNQKTLLPLAKSWWMGDNIPGKKREQLNYLAGINVYENACLEHQKDWKGFTVTAGAGECLN